MAPTMSKSGPKALSAAANLANLLPTCTVLAFQALIPALSNNGKCLAVNKYLTFGVIVCCSIASILSSFTDSFVGSNGKLYYGIATIKGLYIFNKDDEDCIDHRGDEETDGGDDGLAKYRIRKIDFVHAITSLMVFLVFAASSWEVRSCLFSGLGYDGNVFTMNLPLGVGVLASLLFMLFPTKRQGIGYADMAPRLH